MSIKLNLTDGEILALMRGRSTNRIANEIDLMIKLLRHIEKENKGDGINSLTEILNRGVIKMSLYLAIREVILNPHAPYEIKMI